MSTGTDEGAEKEMTENEPPAGDRKQTMIIVLGVVVTILVGLIIGYVVSGGLGGDPAATPTTTSPAVTIAPGTDATTPSTLPPTTVVPGQLAITASEDTYVNSGAPEENNGLEELMELESDPPEIKLGLVRFEVSGIPDGETIDLVTLRLFVMDDSDDVVGVHLVGGDWNQAETTGANAPPVGDQVATITPSVPDGTTVDIDLTSIVQGPGRYDFYLVNPGDDTIEFATIESGTNPPLLIVDYANPNAGSAAASGTAGADSILELSGEPMVLAGAGDIADCGNDGDTVTADLIDEVIAENAQAIVFTAGDNVYSGGTAEEFGSCYAETWGRFKDRTRPAPGNHEYDASEASGYFGYFGEAAGEAGEGYYSYEAGDWQVLALNSNCNEIGGCDSGSPQEQWLRDELASSDARCTLAYWHHPLFSSGEHGGDASVQPLFQALYDEGAEVVVNGHDHDFERFAPQGPDGTHDPVAGIRQFVAGTGGTGNTSIDVIAANSESRFTDGFGILKLSLFSDGYEWEFVGEDGSGFNDVGIEACH
jgi:acid phosphatase type 7